MEPPLSWDIAEWHRPTAATSTLTRVSDWFLPPSPSPIPAGRRVGTILGWEREDAPSPIGKQKRAGPFKEGNDPERDLHGVSPPSWTWPASLSPPDWHPGSHCWCHTKLTSGGGGENGSGFRTIHRAQTRSREPPGLHYACCGSRPASSSESENAFSLSLPPFHWLAVEMTLEIRVVNWFIVPYNSCPSSSSHTGGGQHTLSGEGRADSSTWGFELVLPIKY